MDAAHLRMRILEIIPDHVPGLRQSAIRQRLAARLLHFGEACPSKLDVNDAIHTLALKGLLHSVRRVNGGDVYRIYWREAGYAPQAEEAVHG